MDGAGWNQTRNQQNKIKIALRDKLLNELNKYKEYLLIWVTSSYWRIFKTKNKNTYPYF